jgi:hydrogenase expression/formation protein HypE
MTLTCALPNVESPARQGTVGMKHGSGGAAMRRLIAQTLTRGFTDELTDGIGLSAFDDGAALPIGNGQYVIVTTDSHVVHPIEFPGGDIGRLSICGTVNDLAMMGATEPLGLTCSVVLEDGFPIETLERLQCSMRQACREAGTTVVTGDTKVMGRGEVDKIILNTTGVGITRRPISDATLQPGDTIIVTGTIGDHGIALMAVRHGLGLDVDLISDVAPINGLVRAALESVHGAVVAMKDPTRGGLASALHEMGDKSHVGILLDESAIPVTQTIRAIAEMLGLEPLHIANEGKAVIGVRGGTSVTARLLAALRAHPLGRDAAVIGRVVAEHVGRVVLDTGLGRRLVAEPEGEPLPRIC